MLGWGRRRTAARLGLLTVAWLTLPGPAFAQGAHPGGESLSLQEVLLGITHGAIQGAAVFLTGLAAFAALVWLPASRASWASREASLAFSRVAWVLFGVVAVAGVADLSLYTVLASGDPLSVGLFAEALFDTRVGWVSLARSGFALLVALAVGRAARQRESGLWWTAIAVGGVLLLTLTQESHAAAESGVLPLLSIWLHLAGAALWMGGLLGFPVLLLGPLRTAEPEERAKLLRRAVRRFSKVASVAVMIIVATGLYASLLYVPSFSALVGTPYGRALIMKIGLLTFLLATGGINLRDKGEGPFGRMVGAELVLAVGIFVAAGFLTSLPPADYANP